MFQVEYCNVKLYNSNIIKPYMQYDRYYNWIRILQKWKLYRIKSCNNVNNKLFYI